MMFFASLLVLQLISEFGLFQLTLVNNPGIIVLENNFTTTTRCTEILHFIFLLIG